MTSKDKWMGRQFYPKDTVTRKQMDRQDDRQTRRIDLHRDRARILTARVERLEQQIRLILRIQRVVDEEEE